MTCLVVASTVVGMLVKFASMKFMVIIGPLLMGCTSVWAVILIVSADKVDSLPFIASLSSCIYLLYALLLCDRFLMHLLIRVPIVLCIYLLVIIRSQQLDPDASIGVVQAPLFLFVIEFLGYLNALT